MEVFVGQILSFAFRFAPKGTALTNGQLLPVNQNQALYSLLMNTYGGSGGTFALPDTRGRTIIGSSADGGTQASGTTGGETGHTLTVAEMPTHTHALRAASGGTLAVSPDGRLPGTAIAGAPAYADPGAGGTVTLGDSPLAPAGGNQAHDNMQPSLPINFAIVLSGIYPSRP